MKKIIAILIVLTFTAPSFVFSFVLTGDSLGVTTSGNGYQRDFRLNMTFADSTANDYSTPDPDYPGALGAALAVWQAGTAWNSDNPNAARNFDFDWQGETSGTGANANIIDATTAGACGGGTLAYTELPTSNGWRIRYCDQWEWADGPSQPTGNRVDIQGVGAHELGHALGLGHPSGVCSGSCSGRATMCAFICDDGFTERDLHSDDAAGLEAIYGTIPGNKPTIDSIQGSTNIGGTLRINGSAFATIDLRVKFTTNTSQNTGTIPGTVVVLPDSTQQITVTIPSDAEPGNVVVWKHQAGTPKTSNPYPINIGPAVGAECYGTLFGTPTAGTNGIPSIFLVNAPSTLGNDIMELHGSGFEPSAFGFLLLSLTQVTAQWKTGTYFNVGFPLLLGFSLSTTTDASGNLAFPFPIADDPTFIGLIIYNQFFFQDTGGPDGWAATEALAIEWCDPMLP